MYCHAAGARCSDCVALHIGKKPRTRRAASRTAPRRATAHRGGPAVRAAREATPAMRLPSQSIGPSPADGSGAGRWLGIQGTASGARGGAKGPEPQAAQSAARSDRRGTTQSGRPKQRLSITRPPTPPEGAAGPWGGRQSRPCSTAQRAARPRREAGGWAPRHRSAPAPERPTPRSQRGGTGRPVRRPGTGGSVTAIGAGSPARGRNAGTSPVRAQRQAAACGSAAPVRTPRSASAASGRLSTAAKQRMAVVSPSSAPGQVRRSGHHRRGSEGGREGADPQAQRAQAGSRRPPGLRARRTTRSVALRAARNATAVGRAAAVPYANAGMPAAAAVRTRASQVSGSRLSRRIRSACSATRRSASHGSPCAEPELWATRGPGKLPGPGGIARPQRATLSGRAGEPDALGSVAGPQSGRTLG